MRHLWICCLALVVWSINASGGAETNSPLSVWLQAQTNIHSWSADFIQTRMFKSLTEPLTASGHVWFQEPNLYKHIMPGFRFGMYAFKFCHYRNTLYHTPGSSR